MKIVKLLNVQWTPIALSAVCSASISISMFPDKHGPSLAAGP